MSLSDMSKAEAAMQMNSSIKSRARLVALNFRVPLEVRRRLRMMAAARDVTMSALILEALEQLAAAAPEPGCSSFKTGESGFSAPSN